MKILEKIVKIFKNTIFATTFIKIIKISIFQTL